MKITKQHAERVWITYQETKYICGVPLDATVEIYRDSGHSDLLYTTNSKVYLYEIHRMILHTTKIYLEHREGYRILDFHTGKTRLKVYLTDK